MQQFKELYKDENYVGTLSNIQSCIRLNDLEEIGDGTHLLFFDMLGFFSFREWGISDTIDFWMGFLNKISIYPDYVTIHPNKPEWVEYYSKYDIEVRFDDECIWSDGEIGGYCTEFYKNDIEIGNIVNTLEVSIDCGFGLDRLIMLLTNTFKSKEDTLKESVYKIIESGFIPSNSKQGYVLRKLLRECYKNNIIIEHIFYNDEIVRQEKILEKWYKNKDKHKGKSKEWWWDTFGIDLDLI